MFATIYVFSSFRPAPRRYRLNSCETGDPRPGPNIAAMMARALAMARR
jgi:hypothetical protein